MATEAGIWSAWGMPTHDDGTPDGRYTLATEWTGHHVPEWVGRWCGERVCADVDEMRAWLGLIRHSRERREALAAGEEKPHVT